MNTENNELTTQEILQLPLSKIKKIFKTDPENPAAFKKAHIAAGISTQIFIEKFIDQAVTIHQLQTKNPNSNRLTYDDLAEVSHIDPFVFLKLLIPPRVELIEAYNNEQLRYCFMDDNQKPLDAMKSIGLVNAEGVPRDEDFSESEEGEEDNKDDGDYDEDNEEEEDVVKKMNLVEKVVKNDVTENNDADIIEEGEEEEEEDYEEEDDEDEDEDEDDMEDDQDMDDDDE
ncbi:hypothetical protein HANVADRAFT_49447 [Hanseniaspora valbyensis NRRL Y-1626]|uniref:Histone-fold-containing protein n=1 Tax=Hanseniaspora valbyensis NRRL Y-1626 TaxID=766949 RepID=A0A1B7TBH3_9ASCO|nr:hypothetical protein HANVADRAFT_49447 [Hanseniaspora valbyensis NRRL Y-1626]